MLTLLQSLSKGEQQFLQDRQQYLTAINTMMTSHNLAHPPRTPVIGIALAGGGYRAMQ
jgi:lysophospholipase